MKIFMQHYILSSNNFCIAAKLKTLLHYNTKIKLNSFEMGHSTVHGTWKAKVKVNYFHQKVVNSGKANSDPPKYLICNDFFFNRIIQVIKNP